jgi:AcrR family transcriptional regulator
MKKTKPRPGPGRPSSMDDPHRTICDAAALLFAQKGYDATSLQDVADRVGVTKAGLYYYFPTKDALFDKIVLRVLEEMLETTKAAVATKAGLDQRLTAFMVAHADYFLAHRDTYRSSFFGRTGGRSSDYNAEQLAARRAYVRFLEDILKDGASEGTMKPEDVPTLARGILGMLNWMARWYQPDGAKSPQQIAESYAEILLRGLLKP